MLWDYVLPTICTSNNCLKLVLLSCRIDVLLLKNSVRSRAKSVSVWKLGKVENLPGLFEVASHFEVLC